jgi:hypothetical protein
MSALRRMFRGKREQITGRCRKLQNKEFVLLTKYYLDAEMKGDGFTSERGKKCIQNFW